jgi:hypothetical protein
MARWLFGALKYPDSLRGVAMGLSQILRTPLLATATALSLVLLLLVMAVANVSLYFNISSILFVGFATLTFFTIVQDFDFTKVAPRDMVKYTIYLVTIGILATIGVIRNLDLGVMEGAAVLTVSAEGLGFIGLSLVELTIFLATNRPNEINSLTSTLEVKTGKAHISGSPL